MADQQSAAPTAKEKKANYIALVGLNLGKDAEGREQTVEARTRFEMEESRGERTCKIMMGSTPAAVPATKENIKKYLSPADEDGE